MRYILLLTVLSSPAIASDLNSEYQKAVLEAIENFKTTKPAQAETDVQKAILEACELWK
jgi:hypothetical protein